jgi:uncharacterized membrane protein
MTITDDYIAGKSPREIVNEMPGTAEPGTAIFEQQRMAIFVGIGEQIETAAHALNETIQSAGEKSDRLARTLNWLTLVIAAATVVGAYAAISS